MDNQRTWRITGGGDAVGGFMIDIHDGSNQGAYTVTAQTLVEAENKAKAEHVARFHAPTADGAPISQRIATELAARLPAAVQAEVVRQLDAATQAQVAQVLQQVETHLAANLATLGPATLAPSTTLTTSSIAVPTSTN